MAFDFPNTPTLGMTFSPIAGLTYTWDGEKWTMASASPSISDQAQGQCKLQLNTSTQLILRPHNGNKLKINGALVVVPTGGVTLNYGSITNAVLHYIYAYMSGGTLTLEASTTGHATSTTAGNEGVEIKSGDNTRSLVGMIFGVSGTFRDSMAERYVRSWFNERGIMLENAATATISGSWTSTAGAIELDVNIRVSALFWAGEFYHMMCSTLNSNSTVGEINNTLCFVDGGFLGIYGGSGCSTANVANCSVAHHASLFGADGWHWFTIGASNSGGFVTWFMRGITLHTERRP